jgi:hypothetical protein
VVSEDLAWLRDPALNGSYAFSLKIDGLRYPHEPGFRIDSSGRIGLLRRSKEQRPSILSRWRQSVRAQSRCSHVAVPLELYNSDAQVKHFFQLLVGGLQYRGYVKSVEV